MTDSAVDQARKQAADVLRRAGVVLLPEEQAAIEITDFGLGRFQREGLSLFTYVNTERYCAKELVLLPRQTCPQHRHPPFGGTPGKDETFRCRYGMVFLYLPGAPVPSAAASAPAGSEEWYEVWHEITLRPGQQYTIPPNTWHWFQGGSEGAIVSEFSSPSRDDLDDFADPRVVRVDVAVVEA